MMPTVAAVVASLSVFLFVLWYLRNKDQQEVRVRSLGAQQHMIDAQQASFSQRVAFPMIDSCVRALMAILPSSLIARARKWLVVAGEKIAVSQFFTIVL